MRRRQRWCGATVLGVVASLGALGCGASQAPSPEAVNRERLTLAPRVAPPLTPGPVASYAPWAGFGRDAAHSGTAPVRGPRSGRVRWTRRLEGPVVPGAAVGRDGTVYVASNGGVLHALDPATGRDRWTFDGGARPSPEDDLSSVALVLPDGTILWPGLDRTLFALTPDGRERWRLRLPAPVLSPALGPDGTVYLSDIAGHLQAIDPSGPVPRRRWSISIGRGMSYTSPTVTPDGTVLGAVENQLVAVRATGAHARIRWRFRVAKIIEVTPAVAPDGTIVLGTNDPYQYGVGPDGRERWRIPRNSWTFSSAAVSPAGVAYYGDHRGALNVVDAADGTVLARHVGLARTKGRPDVGIWTAPAIDREGAVYFGTRAGHVYGFTATGRRLFDLDTASPVVSYPALGGDGTLYIGSASGLLYAIGGPGGR